MNGVVFLDYLLIAAALAASWKLFHAPQAPSAGVEIEPPALTPGRGDTMPRGQPPSGGARSRVSANEALNRICVASGYAGIETFLEGAKQAYEAIVTGFAKGDIAPAKSLLSEDVYDDFARAIAERNERGETEEVLFIGFRAAEVLDSGMAGGSAWIEVRFVADLVSVTRDRDGRIVAGHPAKIVDVAELWTFERELRSSQPHWLVTATDADG
jgi:predicted lipid-binding transport protein (Tim44 family)